MRSSATCFWSARRYNRCQDRDLVERVNESRAVGALIKVHSLVGGPLTSKPACSKTSTSLSTPAFFCFAALAEAASRVIETGKAS
jgi:hypothetical protein